MEREKSNDFLHSALHPSQPKEQACGCPNCGEINWISELNYSRTNRIDCKSGSLISTLYGVCRKCAE